MSLLQPIDARAVCNLMLDRAQGRGLSVSNLALQKLLYFAHGMYLVENKRPMVSGYFEAWRHGPVHPTAYKAFKLAGDRPIDFRASRIDPLTGATSAIAPPIDPVAIDTVDQIVWRLGKLTAGRLVELSHAKQSPWHFVVEDGQRSMALGLRISDSLILERYKHHKISLGARPSLGEPGEDAPFT